MPILEIKKLYNVVKELLEKVPYYRDNDNALLCRIWSEQCGGDNILKNKSAYDFLAMYAKGDLHSSESVYRAKRKVMEKEEHLRGKAYGKRKELEEDVRTKIKDI